MFRLVEEMSLEEKIQEIEDIKYMIEFINKVSIDSLLNYKADTSIFKKYNLIFTANGCMYAKDMPGFLPSIIEKLFSERVKYKRLMIEAEKKYEKTKSFEDENDKAKYNSFQYALKILLNSGYGILANPYFLFFNKDNAEAVTSTGQFIIKSVEQYINSYLNDLVGTNLDWIVAMDTDSVYIDFEPLVNTWGLKEPMEIHDKLVEFSENNINKVLKTCFNDIDAYTNAFENQMSMKIETIAVTGIWTAKKRYALNSLSKEGVIFNPPKISITGIEAIKSSTPKLCRNSIKKCLSIIMNEDEKTLQEYVKKFKAEFMKSPLEDIASPRGLGKLSEYYDAEKIYKFKTPMHVKGALFYNLFVTKSKSNRLEKLREGDKIKFINLITPNPYGTNVIAFSDELPKEFGIDEKWIDREMQFYKAFIKPMELITESINWELIKTSNLKAWMI